MREEDEFQQILQDKQLAKKGGMVILCIGIGFFAILILMIVAAVLF